MNIYLLSQTATVDADTYVSCVVIAETAAKARCMHPDGRQYWKRGDWYDEYGCVSSKWQSTWVKDIKDVKVELIGAAIGRDAEGKPSLIKPRVVCASFNAG